MAWRLRPVDRRFYSQFVDLSAHLVSGSKILAQVVDPESDHAALAEQLREAEHLADETAHGIVRAVGQSRLGQFERTEVLAIAGHLDDVMDHMEAAVDLIDLYKVDAWPHQFADLVEVLRRGVQVTNEAMPAFARGEDVSEYCISINRLENQGDRHYRRFLAELFGGGYKSLQVLKLKDIVDAVEHAINSLESAANAIDHLTSTCD